MAAPGGGAHGGARTPRFVSGLLTQFPWGGAGEGGLPIRGSDVAGSLSGRDAGGLGREALAGPARSCGLGRGCAPAGPGGRGFVWLAAVASGLAPCATRADVCSHVLLFRISGKCSLEASAGTPARKT